MEIKLDVATLTKKDYADVDTVHIFDGHRTRTAGFILVLVGRKEFDDHDSLSAYRRHQLVIACYRTGR